MFHTNGLRLTNRTYPLPVRRTVCGAVVLFLCLHNLPCSQEYLFGEPELLFTDTQMTAVELKHGMAVANGYNPYIDHSLWALRQPEGRLRFYYRSMLHQSYHEGFIHDRSFFGKVVSLVKYYDEYTASPKNPMKHRFHGTAWPKTAVKPLTGRPKDQMEYIQNIYAVSPKELLGFVHVERHPSRTMIDRKQPSKIIDRLYAVGIAWSDNGGVTWTYCGDIVLPFWDAIDDTVHLSRGMVHTVLSNIGGIPYLITRDCENGDSLYVFFNETPRKRQLTYPAAARGPLDSVIAYARRGRVVTDHWNKEAFPSWTADPLHGLAGRILPPEPPGCAYDMHSDAAFCSATGQYLMTVNMTDNSRGSGTTVFSLLLFFSVNGTSWHFLTILDSSSRYQPVFSSLISEKNDAAIDSHVVGSDFYILYARRPVADGVIDGGRTDLYAVRITVK